MAFNSAWALEVWTFTSEKPSVVIAGKNPEFVPDVMGANGQIALAVMSLVAARYGAAYPWQARPPASRNGARPTV